MSKTTYNIYVFVKGREGCYGVSLYDTKFNLLSMEFHESLDSDRKKHRPIYSDFEGILYSLKLIVDKYQKSNPIVHIITSYEEIAQLTTKQSLPKKFKTYVEKFRSLQKQINSPCTDKRDRLKMIYLPNKFENMTEELNQHFDKWQGDSVAFP